MVQSPVGSTINPVTGQFSWSPNEWAGGYFFVIDAKVTDETGLSDTKRFRITVNEVNAEPSILAIEDRNLSPGESLNITVAGQDADRPFDQLTYRLLQGPAGASLTSQGNLSWTPQANQAPGVYDFEVEVQDGNGGIGTESFQVRVNVDNQNPRLAAIEDQRIEEDQALMIQAIATDGDTPPQTLTFSLTKAPTSASIDPQSGLITWSPVEADGPGTYDFTVVVVDGAGGRDERSFQVRVDEVSNDVIVLLEEDNFVTTATQSFVVSEDDQQLVFQFTRSLDSTDEFVNDAFEVALLDDQGRSLVHTIDPGRDTYYNFTERSFNRTGANTVFERGGTVRLDLSHIARGTTANLVFRLINNDNDTASRVRITNIERTPDSLGTPAGIPQIALSAETADPINLDSLSDVTGSLDIKFGATSFNAAENALFSQIELTNVGQVPIAGRMIGILTNATDAQVGLIRPDGRLADGRFFIELNPPADGLLPGQTTAVRDLILFNPERQQFDFDLVILSELNQTPTFVSTPTSQIEAGRTLTYRAQAFDPEGQELTYSIVGGNEAIQINAETGELSWSTTSDDIGRHNITVRAADPLGLFIDQAFELDVLESLQNRPPNFVTDPLTSAIASSGFEISTVGVGESPAGVTVIEGFQGPRLVTINSEPQTVGVYAGQNNDRFDNQVIYSTGEPISSDSIFDVGFAIDVGLPAWERNLANRVEGLDQGDFNGDGLLDLVALTEHSFSLGSGTTYFTRFVIMTGQGDGTFAAPEIIGERSGSNDESQRNLLIADFNNDGNLDVTGLRRQRGTNNPPVLYTIAGNGDGTFQELQEFSPDGFLTEDFRLVDLNDDGNLDLLGRTASVSFGANFTLSWRPGNGDGTFGDVVDIHPASNVPNAGVSAFSRPYDTYDFDGDGDLDIVVIDAPNIDILLNDGNENFSLATSIDVTGNPWGFTTYWLDVADYTGDGNVDIAYVNDATERTDLLVGDGTPTGFVETPGSDTHFVRLGNHAGSDDGVDIDADGDLDLGFGVSFGENLNLGVQILTNDGTGKFERTSLPLVDFPGYPSEQFQNGISSVASVLVGDYNQDGVLDIAYGTKGGDFDGVGIRLGTRPGEFGDTRVLTNVTEDQGNQLALVGEFNGDGIQDILLLREGNVMLGNGDGTFQDSIPAVGVVRPNSLGAITDFNRDGLDDVIAIRGNRFFVGLANGDGTFAVIDDQGIPGSFYSYDLLSIADFNNDGYPDVVAKAGVERFIDVFLNDSANPGMMLSSFRTTVDVQGVNVSNYESALTVADVNNDGFMDFRCHRP